MMENTFTSGLISLQEALNKMLSQTAPLTQDETEWLPLTESAGRITASPVRSPVFVPPFDNSAMDGYAIRSTEFSSETVFTVAGKAFAGAPFSGEWPAGSCIRIMTGAPVPTGADAVVMQ